MSLNHRRIKFAIAGCGNIGSRHVAVVDAEPDAEVVAICDLDEARCKELSELYDGLPYYTSFEEMIGAIDADVISICTPHDLHAPMTIQAVEKKFNVLVEKPMAINVNDCQRMIDAARENNRHLLVVKQNRHNVPVKLAKEVLDKGMLGKINMIRCDILWNRYQGYYSDSDWRGRKDREGGALYTQGSHFVDIIVWMFGEIEEVLTRMETKNHTIEIEDCGSAILKFTNGAMGSLNWTTCVYNKNYEGSLTIVGEKGTIKIGGRYLNKIEYWDVSGFPLPEGVDFSDKPNLYGKYRGTSSNHAQVIKAYINKLRNKGADVVDGVEGMKTVRAIDRIYSQ